MLFFPQHDLCYKVKHPKTRSCQNSESPSPLFGLHRFVTADGHLLPDGNHLVNPPKPSSQEAPTEQFCTYLASDS